MKLYELVIPKQAKVPILASIPHSGVYIPLDIQKQFIKNPQPVLTNMDWYVDKLYDFLPELGVTVLQATHSRYVVDLNREVKEPLFGPAISSVIFAENTQGSRLYDIEPTKAEIEARLNAYYYQYHNQLKAVLQEIIGN